MYAVPNTLDTDKPRRCNQHSTQRQQKESMDGNDTVANSRRTFRWSEINLSSQLISIVFLSLSFSSFRCFNPRTKLCFVAHNNKRREGKKYLYPESERPKTEDKKKIKK